LFLGASEAVTAHGALFKPEDKKRRIFSRRLAPTQLLEIAPQPRQKGAVGKQADGPDSRIAQVVARYSPAFAVIDRQQNILQLSGQIGKYLAPGDGVVSLNLSALLHPALNASVRAALIQLEAGRRRIRQEG